MPYPTVPGRRMAWDDDGSLGMYRYHTAGNAWSNLSDSIKAEMNDEDNTTALTTNPGAGPATQYWIMILFPELREFDGFMGAQGAAGGTDTGGSRGIYTSGDTTNGLDGTWTVRLASYSAVYQPYPDNYRNSITSLAVSNIRALRWQYNSQDNQNWRHQVAMHVYGEISPGETPDRLLFIDEDTGLEFDTAYDSGDTPRGSAREKELRLKNNSTAAGNNLTLNSIQFTAEDLYLNAGDWYTFSIAGDAYVATKQISSLAPEAESSLITMRQIVPTTEVLGPQAARIEATVGSYS